MVQVRKDGGLSAVGGKVKSGWTGHVGGEGEEVHRINECIIVMHSNVIPCFWFQILLFCSHGIPYNMSHQQNIHLPLWNSHYRFFWVSILICVSVGAGRLLTAGFDSVSWGL